MKKVSDATKRLMIESPYYGLFLCGLNKVYTDKIDTLAVDLNGINYMLYINKDFFDSLEKPEYKAVLLWHELLHLCLFHVDNSSLYINQANGNKNIANICLDLIVESYTKRDWWVKVDGKYICTANVIFSQFPSLRMREDFKYYLDFVLKLKNELNKQGFGDNSNGSDNSNNSSNESNSSNPDTKEFDNIIDNGLNKMSDKEKEELAQTLDESNINHSSWEEIFGNLTKDQKELIKKQMEFQMKEAANSMQNRGLWPSEIYEKLEQLLKPNPPIFNWKSYFRRCLGIAYDINLKKTRRKESKRFEESPGLKLKKKHKVLVAIDTSGSVNSQEFLDFFSEINHIYKAGASIHILECDADITNEYDYTGKTPLQISGRGGTSFLPVIDWYNKHNKDYTTCIYFTDGYGDQGECKPIGKMLWIITSDGYQESEYPGVKICIPKRTDSYEYRRN